MNKNQKKLIVALSIIVAIFTIGIIEKTFQNDTFFNISIGKYILENGIDIGDFITSKAKVKILKIDEEKNIESVYKIKPLF